jgi:hypothetical protein
MCSFDNWPRVRDPGAEYRRPQARVPGHSRVGENLPDDAVVSYRPGRHGIGKFHSGGGLAISQPRAVALNVLALAIEDDRLLSGSPAAGGVSLMNSDLLVV